jgi:phosphoglycolate phosphatase
LSYPYPLVVFDLDGTLVDSAADIAEALNRTLKTSAWHACRKPPCWADRRRCAPPGRAGVQAAGREVDLAEVMPVFMGTTVSAAAARACSMAWAKRWTQLRARNVPLAICTNKPEALVPPLLQHLGIGDIRAGTGGDSLPQRKPSGEPLRHIAAHFGLPVESCLMVGDSLTDYRAAEDAGMPIALVRYGYPRGLDLPPRGGGDRRPAELPGLAAGVLV